MRIEADEDVPAGYPIENGRLEVDYASVDIAGVSFIRPVKAVESGKVKGTAYRNVTDFANYRRFQTDATVTFDDRSTAVGE